MEHEPKHAAGPQHRSEASAGQRVGNDERRERPRVEQRPEPVEDREPEEAGYGYGV